ncbi:D-2-hydroxyacid dehydrogenase family protein [Luteipulveratus mongoliensis]|uniref:2-hydroxyacid dehydrogenase n=1 Tax=Luteipulveratus mongoliensis TaxID=571913 RepID=A0A0K1JDP4_9MICO|nr:D-2-hydroxyacid dehydrogenase family protein [Luteipulveratus mongoliensis]AKU14831.1 2-hydroxyacid dehydrogenase [Luteipulveratus mongoliensis]
MTRVVVLDDYQQVARTYADWDALGCDVTFVDHHVRDVGALAELLSGAAVVVAMRERTAFSREVLAQLPDLRLLVTTGAKNAAIDMAAAAEQGVIVCGTDSLPHPTAEHALALILSLARQIPQQDRSLREGRWQTSVGVALSGERLGVMGLGRLGSRVAQLGAAFGMDVVAWSPNLTPERAVEVGAAAVSKEELLATSRFVTLHLKLGDRSRGVIGQADLRRMRADAYLINTSRSGLVDQNALAEALQTGDIAGAAVDVYDDEPIPSDDPLLAAPRTILTPHLGYVVEQGYAVYFTQVVEDIAAFLDGAPVRVLA